MSLLDSSLSISLDIADGRVGRVHIASSRPVLASSRLAGRPPSQVLPLLPTLYSLCGTAQGLAGLEAVENAAGHPAAPAQRMARHALELVELLTEHAAAACRDWPALLGEAPDLAALKPLRPLVKEAVRALYPNGDWLVPGGGILAPDRHGWDAILRRLEDTLTTLFGGRAEDRLEEPAEFHAWIGRGDTVAARLLRRVGAEGLNGFGRYPACLMPENGPHDLDGRLAADAQGLYRAAPDCDGRVYETGPLARQQHSSLLAALMAEHGNGLLTRFAARLVEMASALRELEDLVQDLTGHDGTPAPLGEGAGLGLVDAARGLLVHRVEVREGVLSDYRMLAPTEWNFHPAGPLAAGLTGSPAEGAQWRASLLAASLDPCVPYRIEVAPHA